MLDPTDEGNRMIQEANELMLGDLRFVAEPTRLWCGRGRDIPRISGLPAAK